MALRHQLFPTAGRLVSWSVKAEGLALLGLAAFPVLLFREAIFGGQTLFVRDIGTVWFPQVESFVRCVASGSWPLWDPYRGFGQPLLADPSSQVLYPPTWLNLLVRPWHYYTFFAVFHLVVSAFGTYSLARRWSCSRGAAFVAGATWGLSGPLLSLVSLWHHFAGAAWIPWVLLAADKALSSRRGVHAVGWGVVSAVQILAGSADMVAITWLSVLAYASTYHACWRSPLGGVNRRLAKSTALALGVALGLSAALWLPALALARESLRWDLPLVERTSWSLHPWGLLGLLCLTHWGNVPRLLADFPSLRELQAPFLYSVYLGGAASAFVAAALSARTPRRWFLAALALVSVLVALGRHGGAYDAVAALLPPLKILRFPVKWVILVALAWSLLAGTGYDVWRNAAEREGRRWWLGAMVPIALLATLFLAAAGLVGRQQALRPLAHELLVGAGVCGAAALLALALRFRERWARGLALSLAVLAVGELAVRQQDIQRFAPRALFTQRPEVLDHLDGLGLSRLYVYDYSVVAYQGQQEGRSGWGYRLARAPHGFSRQAALSLGVHMYLNPPTAGRWGLYGSYDVDLLGLSPKPQLRLVQFLRQAEGKPSHLRLLRMGSVRYVLALHRERWWDDLVPTATLPGLFADPIQVLRVPDPLPRAYLVSGARIADGESALRMLEDPSFDPAREIILPAGTQKDPATSFAGSSRITRLEPDRVRVEAEAGQAGYLVLTDSYDRGWRVSVDGREAALLRANIAFRAVAVPQGRHQVDFVYRPQSVARGFLISTGTVAAVVGFALFRSATRATNREARDGRAGRDGLSA